MLYLMYETQRRLIKPYSEYLNNTINLTEQYESIFPKNPFINFIQAKNKLIYSLVKNYNKPEFNIPKIIINEKEHIVTEETSQSDTFCDLKFFKKTPELSKRIPLLIVAPLSGHYATLLRDTVKSSMRDFDVYITDWKNCRDIPLSEGDFGFDDYVKYVENYISLLKEQYGELHILAVCQPTVPVLCAVAKMAKEKAKYQADSMTLMGGPIDTRQCPTEVNKYALKNDIDWFKTHVIYPVPYYFSGAGRMVYPGFLQYTGFVSMNFMKHTEAHVDFFKNLLKGADLDAQKHEKFYEEYNSVMDLPAKYYLETLENVFIDQKLAKGTLVVDGTLIDLSEIKNTRLFTIEGELDDISGPGQTHSAIALCSSLSDKNKQQVTIPEVGHYGVFSGRRWREIIYPQIKDFIKK